MNKQTSTIESAGQLNELAPTGRPTSDAAAGPQRPLPAPSFVSLEHAAPLAKGNIRKIFLYPGRQDVIVKVYRKSCTPKMQKKRMHLRKLPFLRLPIKFDQNRYDLKELERHYKRLGKSLWRHFPETAGIFDTSEGPGLVQRRALNFDGTPAPNLYHHLKKHGLGEPTIAAFREFRSFISNHHIVLRDVSRENLLFQQHEDGKCTIVMIDGFGDSDYLKFATLSRTLNDKKILRKFSRLDNQIRKILTEPH